MSIPCQKIKGVKLIPIRKALEYHHLHLLLQLGQLLLVSMHILLPGLPVLFEPGSIVAADADFLRIRYRDGLESLAAPAPQTAFDTAKPDARLFEWRKIRVEGRAVDEAVASEARFDPDIWVVELETDSPETYLDIAET